MSEAEAAEKLTPEQFFDDVVPQILKATAQQRTGVQGTCEIRLFGEPAGAWTVNLQAGTVKQGGTPKPDLYLEMDRADFKSMMMQRLDIEQAIKAGRVRYEGSLPVLATFAKLLEPRSIEY